MALFELMALIMEADSEKRSRCSQAARANNLFKKVQGLANHREFEARLGEGGVDVLFIGCSVPRETVSEVVRIAKGHSEDCACILMANGHEQDAISLASTMIDGIDGFLYEPFSVEALVQVAEVAQELKRVNQERRVKATIKLVVGDMLDSVDDISIGRALDRPTPHSSATLARLHDTVARLGPEAQPFYYEELIEKSAERMVPIGPTAAKGSGSRRKDRNAARWERGNR